MRYSFLALLLATIACQSPTSPSITAEAATFETAETQSEAWQQIHNLPVDLSDVGYPRLGYVCMTQPRDYCGTNGECWRERDAYVQFDPCPEIPIR